MVPPNGENALNENIECCFICGGTEFKNRTTHYRACLSFGHEVLVSTNEQGFIINDYLLEKEVRRMTGLDRFKSRTLSHFDINLKRNLLIDIGSASGKFLLHNAPQYKRAIGIEITPESLAFSSQVLGLEIIEDIQNVSEVISAATAWHSLEHIPELHLLALLDGLSNKMPSGGAVGRVCA